MLYAVAAVTSHLSLLVRQSHFGLPTFSKISCQTFI